MAECRIKSHERPWLNRLNGHANGSSMAGFHLRVSTRNMTLDVDGWGAKHHYLDGRAICDKTEVIYGSYVRLTEAQPQHACSCCQQILKGDRPPADQKLYRTPRAPRPEPAPRVEAVYTPRRFAYQLIKENA